jgi:hypothetical protein
MSLAWMDTEAERPIAEIGFLEFAFLNAAPEVRECIYQIRCYWALLRNTKLD